MTIITIDIPHTPINIENQPEEFNVVNVDDNLMYLVYL
jgi:hypothetical protein